MYGRFVFFKASLTLRTDAYTISISNCRKYLMIIIISKYVARLAKGMIVSYSTIDVCEQYAGANGRQSHEL